MRRPLISVGAINGIDIFANVRPDCELVPKVTTKFADVTPGLPPKLVTEGPTMLSPSCVRRRKDQVVPENKPEGSGAAAVGNHAPGLQAIPLKSPPDCPST